MGVIEHDKRKPPCLVAVPGYRGDGLSQSVGSCQEWEYKARTALESINSASCPAPPTPVRQTPCSVSMAAKPSCVRLARRPVGMRGLGFRV